MAPVAFDTVGHGRPGDAILPAPLYDGRVERPAVPLSARRDVNDRLLARELPNHGSPSLSLAEQEVSQEHPGRHPDEPEQNAPADVHERGRPAPLPD